MQSYSVTSRLLEVAADELARLDALAGIAPAGAALALRIDAISRLGAEPHSEATSGARRSLACAIADTMHAEALAEPLARWLAIVDDEERRARSGAPLTAGRLRALLPAGAEPGGAGLDDALRPGGQPRSVLLRAVAASAALGSGPLADLVPALLLCAAGHSDRIRLLPFAEIDATERAESLAAWADGDEEPFAQLALSDCARAARARRLELSDLLTGLADEDQRLDALGRAAITARRALAELRNAYAITMPALAESLGCSRPAAGDALDRLTELGVAVEITGRGRDRVYCWEAARRLLP